MCVCAHVCQENMIQQMGQNLTLAKSSLKVSWNILYFWIIAKKKL